MKKNSTYMAIVAILLSACGSNVFTESPVEDSLVVFHAEEESIDVVQVDSNYIVFDGDTFPSGVDIHDTSMSKIVIKE